jgi:hypothetical protein
MYTQIVNGPAYIGSSYASEKKLKRDLPLTKIFLGILLITSIGQACAQQVTDPAYQKVLLERSAKIVATLEIPDTDLSNKVTRQIAEQYLQLNTIHDKSKETVAAIKAKNLSRQETDAAIKAAVDKKNIELKQLHNHFITLLQKHLSAGQVEKVKDGMTYRVLPVTWAAYMDMLQNLTPEQKDKMYSWLVEARELAMDEGSSDAKHAVFGKYKGRINNYLSAEGYNMKKEGEEWARRIEAAKKEKKTTN